MPKIPLPQHGWRLIRRFNMEKFSFYNPAEPPRCRRCGRRLTRGHVLCHPECRHCPSEIYVGKVCSKRLRGVLPNPPKRNGEQPKGGRRTSVGKVYLSPTPLEHPNPLQTNVSP